MEGENSKAMQDAVDSIVLEEEIDPNYVPSEAEVVEYAKWLGMDLDKDHDLFWIAREGLMAPLPKDWKPCRTKDTEDIYYFNFSTGDSTWDHPCDGYYKRLYEEEKKKKETVIKESGDQNRSKAKQDVEQLLGKADKKKKKVKGNALGDIDMVKALPAPLGLQKKPLPGIVPPLRMSSANSLSALASGNTEASSGGLSRGGLDAKVTSSLDGPHMGAVLSGGGASLKSKPLLGATLTPGVTAPLKQQQLSRDDSADSKDVEVSRNDRADRKDPAGEAASADYDDDIGRLDVTASLSSKSRVLGTGGKLRAALPSTGGGGGGGFSTSSEVSAADFGPGSGSGRDEKEQKLDSKGSFDENATESPVREDYIAASKGSGKGPSAAHPAGVVRRDNNYVDSEGFSAPSPSATSASTSADLQAYKSRCAELEQRLQECEVRVADYKTSYTTAKEDLAALERRYQTNQSQWVDRLRAVEVEKDKVESERRQLKLSLLDLESQTQLRGASAAPQAPASSGLAAGDLVEVKAENERFAQEILELKKQLQSAESALSRSAGAHAELQSRLATMEQGHQTRLGQAQSQCQEAKGECSKLAAELRATQRRCDALEATLSQSSSEAPETASTVAALQQALSDKEEENAQLLVKLADEATKRNAAMESKAAELQLTGSQLSKLADDKAALEREMQVLQSQLEVVSLQASTLSSAEAALVSRSETAEAQLRVEQRLLEDLRAAEALLRKELSDRDHRLSDQQEQILSLQAAKHMGNANSESDSQMEAFTSQATAVRKSLKAEIERQKVALQDLETEKSNLLTQLTRQETTLQFAKKELNGIASLRDDLRKAETERQQLQMQLDSVRAAQVRAAEQEQASQMKYERLRQSTSEEHNLFEETVRSLRKENDSLLQALEAEKTTVAQKEKKIKSYQEELLQLQRRLAEKATSPVRSPQLLQTPAVDGAFPPQHEQYQSSQSFSPLPSPEHAVHLPIIVGAVEADLRSRLVSKESELKRVSELLETLEEQLGVYKDRVQQADTVARQQKAALHDLSAQLRRKDEELQELQTSQGLLQDLQQMHSSTASRSANEEVLLSKYGAILQAKEQVEAERSALLIQVQELRGEAASARSTVEVQAANVLRLESEAGAYKDKWVAAEKELTALRLQHAQVSRTLELQVSTLREELRQTHAAGENPPDQSSRELGALRMRHDELKSHMEAKDAMIAALHLEGARLRDIARVSSEALAARSASSQGNDYNKENILIKQALPPTSSAGSEGHQSQQHIVTLSMEVGRQQATMKRMEEHMRRTEQMLLDIRSQGSVVASASASAAPMPSQRAAKEERQDRFSTTDAAVESPESISLLADKQKGRHRHRSSSGSSSSSSDSPSPARTSKHSRRAGKTVQFQSTAAPARKRKSASVERSDAVQLSEKVAALIGEHDMDMHDSVSWSGKMEPGAISRVVAEGRGRMKKEAAFLKDLQALCAAAKETITRDQAYVKNLKALWRNAKGRTDSTGAAAVSTEAINSVTLKVNASVDELRQAQQLAKATEARVRDLHQSLQYLQQALVAQGPQGKDVLDQQHTLEVVRLVQQKCVDSAAEMASSLLTLRPKQGGGAGKVVPHTHRHAGVAYGSAASNALHTYYDVPAVSDCWTGLPDSSRDLYGNGNSALTTAQLILQTQAQAPSVTNSPPRSVQQQRAAPASMSVTSIRSAEAKTRILQEQISKITERQSLSKDVCEKHAGWLGALHKEISAASHKPTAAAGPGAGSASRTFGTPLNFTPETNRPSSAEMLLRDL